MTCLGNSLSICIELVEPQEQVNRDGKAVLHRHDRFFDNVDFRSVTLVGEADRKILKAAIKHATAEDKVRHRQVPPEAVAKWSEKLELLKKDIADVLEEEKEEKQVRILLPMLYVNSSYMAL